MANTGKQTPNPLDGVWRTVPPKTLSEDFKRDNYYQGRIADRANVWFFLWAALALYTIAFTYVVIGEYLLQPPEIRGFAWNGVTFRGSERTDLFMMTLEYLFQPWLVIEAFLLRHDVQIAMALIVICTMITVIGSRRRAEKAHNVQLVADDDPLNKMVRDLASQAGLNKAPDVGVYESPDINAFATGATRDGALVAFSTACIEKMPPNEVKAIAAHELGHVANRDMLGMSMVKGINDAVGILITFPLFIAGIMTAYMATSRRSAAFNFLTLLVIRKAIGWLVAFFGNLIRLAYSRQREYRADALAAELAGTDNMIAALQRLGGDMQTVPDEQAQYAMFKVSGGALLPGLLRTHPRLEDRIAALGGPKVKPARPDERLLREKMPKQIWS